jgi:hypothetical protein
MKHFYHLIILLFLLMDFNNSFAQDRGFGLGVIIGEPTGISAKLWTSQTNALDFGLGWSAFDNGRNNGGSRVHFHMDYLWHSFNAIHSSERFPIYYGFGGRFNSGGFNEGSFAIRGVLGIAWLPKSTPLDIFLEVVPSLELTPASGFAMDAAIGARYFFY